MLVLPAAVLLLGSGERRRRWAIALGGGVVVLYCVLLSDGAAYHDYWSFWVLLPVAIGAAHVAEVLDGLLRSRRYPDPVRLLGLAAVLGAVIVPGLARTTLIEDVNVSSAAVSSAISGAELAEDQDTLWALAEFRLGDVWLEELGVPIRHLTEDRYRGLVARGRGDDAVIVSTSCTVEFIACDRIPHPVMPYRYREFRVVRVADLVDERPSPS